MSRVLAVVGAAALFGTGLAAGVVLSDGPPDGDGDAAPRAAAVVVRSKDGTPRELTPAEAAARIERLEAQIARAPRARAPVPAEDEEADPSSPPPLPPEANVPIPTRPDGKPYTTAELRDLARDAADPVLRLAAIRALRRDDSPEARGILGELLADAKTPLEMRVEAAKALARPPHRDATPDQLVALLASADLPPDVRREIADGVARMRDRGAWMSEITTQFAREGDAEVRKLLFETLQRSASDPAAKLELLGIAGNSSASLDDRRLAVAALVRQGGDRKVIETLRPLLDDADPVLRESAVVALARAGSLSISQISDALADESAAVRAAVFAARLPPVSKGGAGDARNAALRTAYELSSSDPSPDVRRAALGWTGNLPKEAREKVLDAARQDPDPLVRIEAYSRSAPTHARQQTDRILSELESQDPKVRDAAYRLVVKVWGVDVPYRAGWNPAARANALNEIRRQVASQ